MSVILLEIVVGVIAIVAAVRLGAILAPMIIEKFNSQKKKYEVLTLHL